MVTDPAERRHIYRIEAQEQNLRKRYRFYTSLQQTFKNFMIPLQDGYCLSLYEAV